MKKKVIVFGAGITGLTAAHELAIRGVAVTVIDKDFNDKEWDGSLDLGVGGIARSQFCGHPIGKRPETPQHRGRRLPLTRLEHLSHYMYDDQIAFVPGKADFADPATADDFFTRLRALIAHQPHALVVLRKTTDTPAPLIDERRKEIKKRGGSLVVVRTIAPGPEVDWVGVSVNVRVFAGEHGFRFFPAFYRHLRDTMRRTPILKPYPSENGVRTVFDNLVPVEELGFARAGKHRAFTLPRHPVMSFEQIRTYLREVRTQLDYTYEDLTRFELALFKYMTSCSERRAKEYENLAWSEFVDIRAYSKIVQRDLEFGPQMALGLRGSKADARTQGNIVTQMMKDQIIQNPFPDALLDGPTSGAWFDHWKDYLDAQGVTFLRGKLARFDSGVPIVDGVAAEQLRADYYVVAVALQDAVTLAKTLPRGGDVDRILAFGKDTSLDQDEPPGPVQHLAGIQYYFDTELKFWRAHTQYLDSPWSLSSISQPQFWARARDVHDNYRSVVSIDIGDWKRPYTAPPTKHDPHPEPIGSAWRQSPDSLAKWTWAQVRDHHDEAFFAKYGDRAHFPIPFAYALDHYLMFEHGKFVDHGGYLVPKTGEYPGRPGALSHAPRPKGQSSYTFTGNIVFAGTYMKTFTRLTSMEAANESARHAVNAILDEAELACDRCEIWDPEDHELDDLAWYKDLDRDLLGRGRPHFMDIMRWRELPQILSPDLLMGRL